ncbi:MAG: TIGR04282 family arsenosugar biosynthesis glycosyltransferase [Candidatus Latescibacteria bacterium]|nr:TIGR04282 family arsenosugar biosynthesis glycosyltransferase [Candidatus Latescibacterota bacterium]
MRASGQHIVIVFVKAPRPGTVKTRLTPFLSAEESARLYRAFIQDTVATVSGVKGVLISVAYTPSDAQPSLQTLLNGHALDWFPQTGDTLGARLWHAFHRAFQRGAARVVTIGSDSPTLPASILTQAFEGLISSDVVIGPATDGGYYLIGLRRRKGWMDAYQRLFEQIAWSTETVFRQTIEAIHTTDLTCIELPRWSDIDQPDDLIRLSDEIDRLRAAGDTARAVHTERILTDIKKYERSS